MMDGKGDVDAVGGLTEGIDGLVVLGLGLCCCIGGGGSSVALGASFVPSCNTCLDVVDAPK